MMILDMCYSIVNISWHQGNTSVKIYVHTTRRDGDNFSKLQNASKISSKWSLNEIQKGLIFCCFSHFLVRTLTLNSFRVAKNHLWHMLWLSKTFLDIREIRQSKKNYGHTTRRSGDNVGNLIFLGSIPLKKKVPCIGL